MAGNLISSLRRFGRDFIDGLLNARDMLLWGQVYPRRLDLRDIWRPCARCDDHYPPGSH